jgi:predicted amidohydrolase YtcJ
MKNKRFTALLAITFSLIFSITHSYASASDQPTHFINANGYTLNAKGQLMQFTEFTVKNDKILSLGKSQDGLIKAKQIDLQGKTVLPGLIDAHGHILGLGAYLLEVDLRGASSEQEAVSRVMQFIGKQKQTILNKDNSQNTHWIIGDGWNQVYGQPSHFLAKQV